MRHTRINTIETSRSCDHYKIQEKEELIQYLHECCVRSTPRNFLKAIKNGNFLTCPGLNNQQLLDNLPPSIATALGHLDQERKNLQPTKNVKSELVFEEDRYFYPDIETVNTHELCANIIPFNIKIKGFNDLTGAFPHNSSRGNLYFIVLYDYDSSAILAKPIKKYSGRNHPLCFPQNSQHTKIKR